MNPRRDIETTYGLGEQRLAENVEPVGPDDGRERLAIAGRRVAVEGGDDIVAHHQGRAGGCVDAEQQIVRGEEEFSAVDLDVAHISSQVARVGPGVRQLQARDPRGAAAQPDLDGERGEPAPLEHRRQRIFDGLGGDGWGRRGLG